MIRPFRDCLRFSARIVRERDDLAAAVRASLACNWTEYAEAPSSKLTAEARRLKRRLRDALEVVAK